MARATLRIGELAERQGVSTATLRYYERLGLLGRPDRTASGYRTYDHDHEERVRFIVRAKALDLSLDEIRALLAALAEARPRLPRHGSGRQDTSGSGHPRALRHLHHRPLPAR